MRNLKRVFSLALACIMVIGMMVMTTGAAEEKITFADFTDKDSITNVEAVVLLNDLGIIEGYPDESYRPTATIDRASMAKLICKIMLGDVASSTFEGTQTDLTDIDGHWAEGFIKYCYANGIISGDGNGTFRPNDPVTVVEAAKMLLVALGYDAETQGYVGGNWSTNIMRDAVTTRNDDTNAIAPLNKGVTAQATDPLTRDNAAQMILNTLFAETAIPVYQWDMGTQHINGYSAGVSLENTMYGNLTRNAAVLTSTGTDVPIAGLTSTYDQVGCEVVYYTKAGGALVSSTPVVTGRVKSYTVTALTGTSDKDKTDALIAELSAAGLAFEKGAVVNAYANYVADAGNNIVATTDNYPNDTVVGSSKDIAYAAETLIKAGGVTKAIIIDEDGNGYIDSINIVKEAVDYVSAVSADGKTITFQALGAKSAAVLSGDKLAKGDVVLTTNLSGGKYAVVKAEIVTGTVDSVNTPAVGPTTITVNGTNYSASAIATTNAGIAVSGITGVTAGDDTVKLFLDNAGKVIGCSNVTANSNVYDLAYVLKCGLTSAPTAYSSGKVTYYAYVLFADGTHGSYEIDSLNGKTVVLNSTAVGGDTTTKVAFDADAADADHASCDWTLGFYNVTLKDGKAVLKDMSTYSAGFTTAVAAGTAPTQVIKGNPVMATGLYATEGTNYFFVTSTDPEARNFKFTVAKGYNEAAKLSNVGTASAATYTKNGVEYASAAMFAGSTEATAPVNDIYWFDGTINKTVGATSTSITYTLWKDGVSEDYTVTTSTINGTKITPDETGMTTAAFVKKVALNVDDSGLTTTLGGGAKVDTDEYLLNVVSGMMTTKGGEYYTTDGVVVTELRGKTDIEADGVDAIYSLDALLTAVKAGNSIKLQLVYDKPANDSDGTAAKPYAIKYIYVTDVTAVAESTSVTLAAGSSNGAAVTGTTENLVTDGVGNVTGWANGSADTIKITIADAAGTSSTMKINGDTVASGADYDIAAVGALDVQVTVTVTATGAVKTFSYSVVVE